MNFPEESVPYPQLHTANYYNIKIYNIISIIILSALFTPGFGQDETDIKIANEYLAKGEKEKALAVFESLLKRPDLQPLVHDSYLQTLLELTRYREAENYLERLVKRQPDKVNYQADLGIVYLRSGDEPKADKYFRNLIKAMGADVYRIKFFADYLTARALPEYATLSLQEARVRLQNPSIFSLEMANLYRLQGKRAEMVNEYLEYATQTPGNSAYIKNLLQILLSKTEEMETLEQVLVERVQKFPDNEVYADLLVWVQLQQKNFYGAFIQARAYDKRFKKDNFKTLEVAGIALNNKDYDNADRAYSFLVKEYPQVALQARLGQVKSREGKIKNRFPVKLDSIRYLIGEYENFLKQFANAEQAHEAELNVALLHAYYLNEKDSAILKLNYLLQNPRVNPLLVARTKLELGDVYILKDEPWESILLYAQVERTQRDAPLGYEAKLRNAKLSYYKGEFQLAEAHLDILKEATTRDIANDAIDLNMRIKENLFVDTLGQALKKFAAAELLVYQNKIDQALNVLEEFEEKKTLTREDKFLLNVPQDSGTMKPTFNTFAIMDDVYWLKANLLLKKGLYAEAITALQKITGDYKEDILADDAAFLEAEIIERYQKKKPKAMELYRQFLERFPGSVYVAEARKRFRTLRGDFDNVPKS
jgi:predicted Zn-dependent protease